eukprot:TRINITY_DN96762_c0_g1_i1.p1 TRINITY_DN96762_c0_g1~~TRINITY_DN96762_c0_g1_i1.p1  ORF type:complete len:332 (+),score=65.22 TRINITY_DN96762_c0_g1_i1:96-1091(+)
MVKKASEQKKDKAKSKGGNEILQLQKIGGIAAGVVLLLAVLAGLAKLGSGKADEKKIGLDSAQNKQLQEQLAQQLPSIKAQLEAQLEENVNSRWLSTLAVQPHLIGDEAGKVGALTAKTFLPTMITYQHGVLVDFYTPGCGHCKKLEPHFTSAARRLKGKTPLMKVDCSKYASLCEDHGITRYPTLKWFRKGLNVLEASPRTRDADKIVKWVDWASEDALTVFDTVAEIDESLQTLRDVTMPNASLIVAYASKDESIAVLPELEIVAEMLRGKTAFIFVKEPAADGISVRAYGKTPETDATFAGTISASELLRWIAGFMEVRNKWDIETDS